MSVDGRVDLEERGGEGRGLMHACMIPLDTQAHIDAPEMITKSARMCADIHTHTHTHTHTHMHACMCEHMLTCLHSSGDCLVIVSEGISVLACLFFRQTLTCSFNP